VCLLECDGGMLAVFCMMVCMRETTLSGCARSSEDGDYHAATGE